LLDIRTVRRPGPFESSPSSAAAAAAAAAAAVAPLLAVPALFAALAASCFWGFLMNSPTAAGLRIC